MSDFISITKQEREDEPSFPSPTEMTEENLKAWNKLMMQRPFEEARFHRGTDYHKDKDFDEEFGGFVGDRLVEGYKMLDDSDD